MPRLEIPIHLALQCFEGHVYAGCPETSFRPRSRKLIATFTAPRIATLQLSFGM